jgi:hypothetical protein
VKKKTFEKVAQRETMYFSLQHRQAVMVRPQASLCVCVCVCVGVCVCVCVGGWGFVGARARARARPQASLYCFLDVTIIILYDLLFKKTNGAASGLPAFCFWVCYHWYYYHFTLLLLLLLLLLVRPQASFFGASGLLFGMLSLSSLIICYYHCYYKHCGCLPFLLMHSGGAI